MHAGAAWSAWAYRAFQATQASGSQWAAWRGVAASCSELPCLTGAQVLHHRPTVRAGAMPASDRHEPKRASSEAYVAGHRGGGAVEPGGPVSAVRSFPGEIPGRLRAARCTAR